MGLHTIPTELRLVIANFLDARSCFKLALTSNVDHRLYSSLLANYKALFARYNTIDTDDAGRLIWDVTKEIIENPEIAQYVEDISLPNTRQSVWVPDTDLDMWKVNCPILVPEAIVQQYIAAANKIPMMENVLERCRYDAHFYGPNWNMEQTIRIGSDEPIAALLIAMASNLRILRFTEFDDRNELPHLIKSIALACNDLVKAPSLPLQHLTHVAISYSDTEMCCQAQWADMFISLPSLRGFAASKMGGALESWRENETIHLPTSNVKDMLFDYSLFVPEALERIIRRTTALRSFIYDNGGPCVSDEGCFAPRRVTAALSQYAAHSLEELVLSGADYDDYGSDAEIDSVSLRSFVKLRTLRCSWRTITGEEPEDDDADEALSDGQFHTDEASAEDWLHNLANRLPVSLEALHLELDPSDAYWKHFVRMIRESRFLLPNLRRVHVRNQFKQPIEDLLEALEERNIAFDPKGDFASEAESYTALTKIISGQGVI